MYECEKCKAKFESYRPFSTHCNRKHNIVYSILKEKYFPKIKFQFKCKRCEKSFQNYIGLKKHSARIHKISAENFYIEYNLSGIVPLCKCGCGEKTSFSGHGFHDYKVGHISRIKNNWGHNQIAIDNSAKTRREQYANGKRKVWNDGLTKETNKIVAKIGKMSRKDNNPERAKKISNALKGVPKSPEHAAKFATANKKYWDNPENRKNQGKKKCLWLKENYDSVKTKLEEKFEVIFKDLNIKFETQYYVEEIPAIYDFYLPDYNILVESDGDIWHEKKENIIRDKIKDKWAKNNGFKILRFLGSELFEHPAKVINTILQETQQK